tara:strand:- start:7189 stop:7602 length:414 start_codon:yes stop_codon:yes gene_type:complete
MIDFLLYLLVFIFGYYTCKTFYIFRAGHLTINILRMTHITALTILVKSIEQYTYIKAFGCAQLDAKGATETEIKNYSLYIQNDMDFFKERSIQNIVRATPSYFKETLYFNDWESAMGFLNDHKKQAFRLITKDKNDD